MAGYKGMPGPAGATGAAGADGPSSATGNARDGDLVLDGAADIVVNGVTISPVASVYTLTYDSGGIQADTLTASPGVFLEDLGFPCHARSVVGPGSGTFTIRNNGGNATGLTGGAGTANTRVNNGSASFGGANENATNNAGNAGQGDPDTSYGGAGGNGGASGAGNAGGTAAAMAVDTGFYPTASEVAWNLVSESAYTNSVLGGGAGGGGGFGPAGVGAGPGAGGGGGGCSFWAVGVVTNATRIKQQAKGGNGGNAPGTTFAGGGGPGGGGFVAWFYQTTDGAIVQDVAAGTVGAGGSISGNAGVAGSAGTAVYQSFA